MTTSQLSPLLPVYSKDKISLKKLSRLMGTRQESLARIIHRDVRTVQRDTVSKAMMKEIQPLIYAMNMLFELAEHNEDEVKRWLSEPRPEWLGKSPLDCLEEGNINAVVNLISRIYYGDSAGS